MSDVQQQELPFTKRRLSKIGGFRVGRVRVGRLPAMTTLYDIDKIIGPHGEAAQDSFDRDVSMMDRDDYYDD